MDHFWRPISRACGRFFCDQFENGRVAPISFIVSQNATVCDRGRPLFCPYPVSEFSIPLSMLLYCFNTSFAAVPRASFLYFSLSGLPVFTCMCEFSLYSHFVHSLIGNFPTNMRRHDVGYGFAGYTNSMSVFHVWNSMSVFHVWWWLFNHTRAAYSTAE